MQIEGEFQAQKKREEDARKAEVARKEQERMENMKRKEVQRITDVCVNSQISLKRGHSHRIV